MFRNSLFIFLLWSFLLPAIGQKQPRIYFEEKEHDFGTFSESLKTVTCSFRFTNTGDAPLVVVRTIASCGCTKPTYTEEPIAPGDTGVVTVTYNAVGRPGAFQKVISVYSNGEPQKSVLTIKGNVTPRTPVKNPEYVFDAGEVRLKANNLAFFDVTNRQTKQLTIGCYNQGNRPVTLYFRNVPTYIEMQTKPERIPANGKGEIQVTYRGTQAKNWGERDDVILVSTQRDDPNPLPVVISANLVEDFDQLTPTQLENAPELYLPIPRIDFGQINSQERLEKEITITNRGKSPLILRKLEPNALFIRAHASQTTLAPGTSARITVTVEPTHLKGGLLNHQILLIANDPQNPVTRLRVTGYFKE